MLGKGFHYIELNLLERKCLAGMRVSKCFVFLFCVIIAGI